MTFEFLNHSYDLYSRTYIMGILNITPDSFSDGGKYYTGSLDLGSVLRDAEQMVKDGADFLDVGGESTRPGSEQISIQEELDRVLPVIQGLKSVTDIPISIDTYKNKVADEALKAGAEIVNDISGFRFDPDISSVTAKHKAGCILMHIKGTPKDMQSNPVYENVIDEVFEYLSGSIKIAEAKGINRIITDVGIGFGKTLEHNLQLLRNLDRFKGLGYPILLGVSRKSFIDKIFPATVGERLEGTIAANVFGITKGANILRVHDVKEHKKAIRVIDAVIRNTTGS